MTSENQVGNQSDREQVASRRATRAQFQERRVNQELTLRGPFSLLASPILAFSQSEVEEVNKRICMQFEKKSKKSKESLLLIQSVRGDIHLLSFPTKHWGSESRSCSLGQQVRKSTEPMTSPCGWVGG